MIFVDVTDLEPKSKSGLTNEGTLTVPFFQQGNMHYKILQKKPKMLYFFSQRKVVKMRILQTQSG